jgi:hypothetical protein
MKKHDRPEPRLELRSFEPGYVTISARIPRPAPGAEELDIESTGRHAISALVRRLLEAGGDPSRITRTRLHVAKGAYGVVLASVRDQLLSPAGAIHSIFLADEDAEDAFSAEIDAPARLC